MVYGDIYRTKRKIFKHRNQQEKLLNTVQNTEGVLKQAWAEMGGGVKAFSNIDCQI